MTAIAMGNHARNPLAHLPTLTPSRKKSTRARIRYQTTASGTIAYIGSKPVAWLYPGHHQGVINGEKRTIRFIDVAYHRATDHGVNLETSFYDSMDEARAFIAATFGSKGGVQ